MYGKTKRALSLVLALSMLLSLFTMSVSASSTDNTLELDTVEQVTVTAGVSTPVYFTPAESGAYWFESLTGYDTYANLYDDQDNYLANEDWGGMDQNFGFYYTLEAGVTYRLEVSYCVDSSTPEEATIPVVVRRSLVASVVAQPVSLMVGTKGNIWNSGTPEAYFHYDWQSYMTYTVTFTNGDVQTYSGYHFYYEGQYYNVVQEGDDGQSYNTQWEAGKTYTPTFSIAGCKANASVTITASPVASVSVNPITVIEGSGSTNYGWDFENNREVAYHYYDWFNKISCVVTFTDGTTQQIAGSGFYYNGEYFGIPTMDSQNWNTPWTVGNTYTATINIMGREVQVDVSVVPSPIKSIVANPLSIKESESYLATDWDSETGQDVSYQKYSWYWRASYTITFTDDSVLYVNGSSFQYNGETHTISFRDDQYWDNPWTAGNTYIGIATIMGVEVEVPVTITPLPVVSIDVQPVVLAENTGGSISNHWDGQQSHEYYHYYWWQNMTTEITFIDGSTRIVVGTGFYYDNEWFNLSYQDTQSYADPFLPGQTYTATVTCGKAQDQVEITIAEPLESNGFEYIVQNDDAIITNCTKTDKSLTIPETLGGKTVAGIVYLGNTEELEELILPDSLTMLSGPVMETPSLKHLHLGAGIRNFSMDMLWRMDSLEEITVSQSNPWYTSVDGVVYDKDVTCAVAYPVAKKATHVVPDSVTDLTYIMGEDERFAYVHPGVNLQTGAGTPQYITVDGVVYDREMTTVYSCAMERTGRYVMPDTVERIGKFAFNKTSLEEVTIAPGVTEITYGSFAQSTALEKIEIPSSVTTIDLMAFESCTGLEEVHIEDLAAWCKIDFVDNPLIYGENLYLNGQLVQDLVIPDVVSRVYYAAFYNANLNSVTIPSTVVSIADSAFRGSSVKTLNLTEGLERIGYSAFRETNVQAVHLPDSLTYMAESAFLDCESLQELTIGTGLVEIMWNTFANTGITSLVIPENVEAIFENAFADSALREVVFENDAIYIGYAAFKDCPLEAINLGDNVSYIEDKAFMGNKAVTLKIPDSVTQISYRCFDSSKYLISVSIPETVEVMGPLSFDNCDNLSHVYYGGTQDQWEELGYKDDELEAATVHFETEGDEFTVTRTCTQIEHVCNICQARTVITLEVPEHNMVGGVCTKCGHTDGPAKEGWVQEGGKWCFYENGVKLTNAWKQDSKGWCYLGADGYMVYSKWIEENNEKYYIGSNGYMVTGTQTIGGKEYKFATSGALLKHTVIFKDWDGTKLSETVYFYGDTVTTPAAPARAEDQVGTYAFSGWGKTVTAVTGDATYTATYTTTYKEYTITFMGMYGLIEKQTLHWDDEIDPPIVVTEEDEEFYYYFAEWDKELVPVAGDATYTARYDKERKPTLNGWVEQFGQWYYYEDGVKLTNAWKKDASGWCYLGEDGAIVMDSWITDGGAMYYLNASGYKVINSWKLNGENWCYLDSEGKAVTSTWIKDSAGWCYLGADGYMVYSKWIEENNEKYYIDSNGYMVTGTQTIGGKEYKFATSGALLKHTVIFKDWDGTKLSETVYFYGDAVTAPAAPSKVADQVGSYTFAGWDKAVTAVTGDTTYTATYDIAYKEYTITFLNGSGGIMEVQTLHWGDVITAPTARNYEDDSAVYTFAGWDKTLVPVDGDATYTAVYTAKLKEGWIADGAQWTYYRQGQKVVNDWVQDGATYFMGEDGYMVTNEWQYDGIGWCYLGADGKMLVNKWIQESQAWCYVDTDGHMVCDQWVRDSKGWCYLSESGYMARDCWVEDSVGICYLDNTGHMVYNKWMQDQHGWRYVDKTGYAVAKSWVKDKKGWCYLGEDSYMVTNQWIRDGVGWCYLGEDGYMTADKWISDESGDRYVDKSGYLATNRWVKNTTGWRYVGADGYVKTDCWVKDSVGWCFVAEDGYMVFNQWVADSKGLCYVDASGYQVINRWVKDTTGWSYVNKSGYQVTAQWIKDSVGMCYVDTTGYMVYDQWVADGNNKCYVDKTGYKVVDNWVLDETGWCYVDKNGHIIYSQWVEDSKGWCYVDVSGYMTYEKWVRDSKGWCYVGDNGYMVTNGWAKDSVGVCYMDASGYMVYSRWIQIGGSWYYVNNSGYMLTNTTWNGYHFNESGVCTNP